MWSTKCSILARWQALSCPSHQLVMESAHGQRLKAPTQPPVSAHITAAFLAAQSPPTTPQAHPDALFVLLALSENAHVWLSISSRPPYAFFWVNTWRMGENSQTTKETVGRLSKSFEVLECALFLSLTLTSVRLISKTNCIFALRKCKKKSKCSFKSLLTLMKRTSEHDELNRLPA